MRLTTWGDLDFRRRLLVLRAEHTKASRERVIPLRDGMVGQLRTLQELHREDLGFPCGGGDPIFLTPEGSTWARPTTNPMRIFDRILKAAGIPRIDERGYKLDIHALRHTFISRLERVGVPLVHVQRLAGHSDPKLTAQVYSRLGTEDLRGAIERLPGRANENRGKVIPMAARGA